MSTVPATRQSLVGALPLDTLRWAQVLGIAPTDRSRGIPPDTILVYQATWKNTAFNFYTDILNVVSQRAAESGIAIRNSQIISGGFYNLLGPYASYQVELTLQVTGVGFAKIADVASIINNGVWRATGQLPSTWSVPRIQLPGQASQQPTGQAEGNPSPPAKPTGGSWWSRLTGWISAASYGALIGGIGVFVLLIVALFFIGGTRLKAGTHAATA